MIIVMVSCYLFASPVTVPETTVPFLSSIVTDSLFNFIKNLFNGDGFKLSIRDEARLRCARTQLGNFHKILRIIHLTSFMVMI